jgi:hypothetical protein
VKEQRPQSQQQPQRDQQPQYTTPSSATLELRDLTPIPVVYEGQLLKWQPQNPGDSVTVTIPPKLCRDEIDGGVLTATYDQPAQCIIADQVDMLDNQSRKYSYTLSSAGGPGGDPDVIVKRCIGC